MKELVIISGKGGTGKTSLVAAFASLAEDMILCDADVDAADLHLLLTPDIVQQTDFVGGNIAIIDQDKCNQCGYCRELCRFSAISEDFVVDDISCEGCGVCVDLCPEQAIEFPEKTCGEKFISKTRFGTMVHARLGIAEENSGKLVSQIRKEASALAEKESLRLILTDGPPGIGCPVIASITGATGVLIVAEASLSGLHDMERVAELAAHFKIPAMVCINKFDLNPAQTQAIEEMARRKKITILGRIPFDPIFTHSMIEAKNIFEYDSESKTCAIVKKIWDGVLTSAAMNEDWTQKEIISSGKRIL